MEISEASGESSWGPSGSSSGSSEVSLSDLDEFIMTTSQSGALSRQRKKAKVKDGLMPVSPTNRSRKKKKKKRLLSTPLGRLPQEVRDLLGQGHNAFLKRDYDTAVSLLEEAIRLAPGVADPFVTLGAIYEELDDAKRSLEALLVAVHLTPGDTELWKRVAIKSEAVGNVDQAIYCLKRCVKASAGDRAAEEPFLRDLGTLYVRSCRFPEAVLILRKIFSLDSEDAVEIGSLLAKSLYNVNEKSEAMGILESMVNSPAAEIDANIINMLAEVYIDIREWGRCFTLLTSVLDMDHLDDPEKCPVDLVAKLALAAAPTYQRHSQICMHAIACILSTPVDTHSDLYLIVADGLIANNLPELAWRLLEPALAGLADQTSELASIKGRAGKCCYSLGRYPETAEYLSEFVEHERRQQKKIDPDSLVMLADALRRTGRENEAGELLLHSLNYEDLLACRTLPAATSTTQRRKMLETLNHLLATYPNLSEDISLEPVQRKFATTFLQLLNDCELDSQRIARHRAQNAETAAPSVDDGSSVTGGQRLTPAWRLRKELDLEGVEESLGAKKFVDFVVKGAAVCAAVSREKETVELIEAILYNKRKKWSQRTSDEEEAESEPVNGGALIETLEQLSFKLSVEAKIHKVSTKYLRQSVVEHLEGDKSQVIQAIARMTQLMFGSDSDYVQREILDQRSWLVRQACKYPHEFALCMMCGQMCIYSSNFRFASQEFLKAHRLSPSDPWPLLCLGASLLSLAMSRTTKDRQLTILKAFSVLSMYAKNRGQMPTVEIHYNFARAYHQLSLWSLADGEYRKALAMEGNEEIKKLAAYNLALIRARSMNTEKAKSILMFHIRAS
jgi:general transcription factor 3C polypeptide 3 (transcription factor C subunit 4)